VTCGRIVGYHRGVGYGTAAYGVYRVLHLSVWVLGANRMGRFKRHDADQRARDFGEALVRSAQIRLTVRGGDNLPPDRPFVYMSNHQSMFDIPVLWATIPAQTLRFVAKTELFRTPIWGQAMRVGEIVEIDRGDREKAIASLRSAVDLIHSGVSVWIAPEGHRSATGRIGPLKRGGFYLARDAGVDIVPVAINGTVQVLPPKELRVRKGKAVDVTIGEPISTAGRDIDELMDDVRRFLVDHVDQDVVAAS